VLTAGCWCFPCCALHAVFQGDLFNVNQWQHMLPDYVVLGEDFARKGWAGSLAAGYWGNRWEYEKRASFVDPASCGRGEGQ
jgi:hypothetical protein